MFLFYMYMHWFGKKEHYHFLFPMPYKNTISVSKIDPCIQQLNTLKNRFRCNKKNNFKVMP